MPIAGSPTSDRTAVVVWLDRWHAVVARREHGRHALVEVQREAEAEPAYLRRVAATARDCRRLSILGPDDERLAFDREYISLYERPDLFVDVEASAVASPSELLDRLRLLEGDDLARPMG